MKAQKAVDVPPVQRSNDLSPLSLQDYKRLCAYVERQRPRSEPQMKKAIGGLAQFPPIVWMAAVLGALDTLFYERVCEVPEIVLARSVAEDWLSCPCPYHLQQARLADFPSTKIARGDEVLEAGQLAASHLVTLIIGRGSIDHATEGISVIASLPVFTGDWVWESVAMRLRCLEFMDVVIEEPSQDNSAAEIDANLLENSTPPKSAATRASQLLPRFGVRARQIALLTLFVAFIAFIITIANIAKMTTVIINRTSEEVVQLSSQISNAIQQDIERTSSLDELGDPYVVLASAKSSSTRGLMESTVINTPRISYIYITDINDNVITNADGKNPLVTNAQAIGDLETQRPDLTELTKQNAYIQLIRVFGREPVYQFNREIIITNPISSEQTDFGNLHIGVSSLQIYKGLIDPIQTNLWISFLAILASAVIASMSANTLLRPLEAISGSIEKLSTQGNSADAFQPKNLPHDDVVTGVTTRLKQLGARLAGEREELEIMRGRLRQVVNHLEDRLILINREGRVILASPDAERLLGLKNVELTGLPIDESLGLRHPLVALVERSFNERRSIARTTMKSTGDLTRRQLLASVQYIEDAGTPVGVLIGLRDYESYQKFESQWDLSKKLADLGRITSGIAHEVKNPLNAMVIHLEILRSKIELGSADTRPQIEILDSEIKRLDRVVQTFLNFTRPVEIRLEPLDLNLIINQVLALASMEAAERGVTINKEFAEGKLMIKGDSDLLKQALLNVILNGCQAMPKGGPLDISTMLYGDDKVRIQIKDSGVGIPQEARDRVFNLYYTTKQGGTGIGLAQAFRAVQLHNGTINFDSEVGNGTSFEIILPALE
jgi:PAS domain S-box-containing protein